jgi:hypothetical protein
MIFRAANALASSVALTHARKAPGRKYAPDRPDDGDFTDTGSTDRHLGGQREPDCRDLAFGNGKTDVLLNPTAQPRPDQSNSVPVATSISRRPVVPLDEDLSELRGAVRRCGCRRSMGLLSGGQSDSLCLANGPAPRLASSPSEIAPEGYCPSDHRATFSGSNPLASAKV